MTTRILIINPVGINIWDDLTHQAVKTVLSPNTEVVIRSLKEGPPAIESDYDRDLAAYHVIKEVLRANVEGFDAVVINCFDDPGLQAAREVSDTLVLGIGETSLNTALNLGYRIAIISTGKHSKNVYYRKAAALGILGRIAYTGGVEIEVLDIRKDLIKVKRMLIDEIKTATEVFGAEVIVLGCGGFIGLAEELTKETNTPVIDPTLVTVKVAEALATLKLKHSKLYLFNRVKHPYKV